ncbi:MAG: phosphoribosylformylglycinamidine synthase I [Armatimonadetes bacterium]|nr:phosphoribosylformylglycinamidine synthase I [Armatimonadota bacterium]
MRVAVVQFPGSNCDQDALYALREQIGVDADYVWHDYDDLIGFDAVFIPGGFSYGDYLRCGAVAARAPIMSAIKAFAIEGRPIIGVCNGFQVLCESGVLPGALLLNGSELFVCKNVQLQAVNRSSLWTQGVDRVFELPIAHGEGRYICQDSELEELRRNDQIAFLYVDSNGNASDNANPNGSIGNIAGVLNRAGNVLGMMPHPERATAEILGGTDGRLILQGLNLVSAQ